MTIAIIQKQAFFTAPCDGVFVFIVQFHASSNSTEVGLYIDNINETRAVMHKGTIHGTTSLITRLTKDQVVDARLMRGKLWVGEGNHTSFQGFQI